MKFLVLLVMLLVLGCQFNKQPVSSGFEILFPNGKKNLARTMYQVNMQRHKQSVVFDIYKPGRGTLSLKRKQKAWSEKLFIRLYLAGLEGVLISQGKNRWGRKDLSIQAFDEIGERFKQRHLLKKKGHYQIEILASELEQTESEIKIHWVNFYLK